MKNKETFGQLLHIKDRKQEQRFEKDTFSV